MSNASNQAAVAAVLVPLWLFALGVLWKSSHLRGDVGARWSSRVGLAVASLTERAANALLVLNDTIASRLGGLSEPFDPWTLVTDPSELVEATSCFQTALKDRDRLRRWHGSQVRAAPYAIALSTMLVLVTALQSLYLLRTFGRASSAGFRWALITMWIVLGVGGFALGARYIYLEQRISGAELRSKKDRE